VVKGKEEDPLSLREERSCRLISGLGHGRQKDKKIGEVLPNPFKERDGADHFSDGCGMDPDRSLARKIWNKPHPMGQELPKAFPEEASQKGVRNIEDQEKGEKDVVESKDHRTALLFSK
jgi:hypothetical protein